MSRCGVEGEAVGRVIASCGCEVPRADQLVEVAVADLSRECEPVVSYMVVCTDCAGLYRREGVLLETDVAIEAWLAGGGRT